MSAIIMTEEKIYTVKEVAAVLRTTPRSVWKMINDGELEAFRVRGDYRIRQSALDALMGRNDPPKEES